MAVTASWYGKGLEHVASGDVNWTSDTIKVALVESAYTPNIDTHEFFDTHVSNEASGTGYTSGGATLASKTITYVTADDAVALDAANTTWSTSTVTARYAVVYVAGATPGTDDYLLGWVNFGQDESTSSSDFNIVWDADGILRITAV